MPSASHWSSGSAIQLVSRASRPKSAMNQGAPAATTRRCGWSGSWICSAPRSRLLACRVDVSPASGVDTPGLTRRQARRRRAGAASSTGSPQRWCGGRDPAVQTDPDTQAGRPLAPGGHDHLGGDRTWPDLGIACRGDLRGPGVAAHRARVAQRFLADVGTHGTAGRDPALSLALVAAMTDGAVSTPPAGSASSAGWPSPMLNGDLASSVTQLLAGARRCHDRRCCVEW